MKDSSFLGFWPNNKPVYHTVKHHNLTFWVISEKNLPSSIPLDSSESEFLSDLVRPVLLPEPVLGDFPREGDNDPDLVEGEQGLFKEFLVPFGAGLVVVSLTGPVVVLDVRLPAGFAVGRATGFGVGFGLASCTLLTLPALFRVCLVPQPAIFSGFIHSSYLKGNEM